MLYALVPKNSIIFLSMYDIKLIMYNYIATKKPIKKLMNEPNIKLSCKTIMSNKEAV